MKPGERCPKGFHLCMEPKCQKPHSLVQHKAGRLTMHSEFKDLSQLHIEQVFMIEVFAGAAVLCSVAKQHGMHGSIAVDKIRKKNARSSIFTLDLTLESDRELIKCWVESPLLVWLHFAPVCGTASRARDIRRFPGDPQPLRSCDWPEGLPNLNDLDSRRVDIANSLFEFSCDLFKSAARRGLLVSMENPKNSYFWITKWVISLMCEVSLFGTDFQVCMLGGDRDKWTKIVANYPEISQMDIKCDKRHPHASWGFSHNHDGKKTWATSIESQYPKKMCVCLVQTVLQRLHKQGLVLQAASLEHIADHPLKAAQRAQISAGVQSRGQKLPPLVPEFSDIIKCYVPKLSDLPCNLMTKLKAPLDAFTSHKAPIQVPSAARLLRFHELPDHAKGVGGGQQGAISGVDHSPIDQSQDKRLKLDSGTWYEAVFGAPWGCEAFIQRACKSGHPLNFADCLEKDLLQSVSKHVEWSSEQLASYRIAWCRKWLKRSVELANAEKESWLKRPKHVQEATKQKRLLLTSEILAELQYEDMGALELLHQGATLAGEVEKSPAFQSAYKPCMTTVAQLEKGSSKRNEMILSMTRSSGDSGVDAQLMIETEEELAKGWAIGPFSLKDLEEGAVVSRRFPLIQSSKTRMIDDFSISGVNDSTVSHNKIELHTIDCFCAMVRAYFERRGMHGLAGNLLSKTYDLKSAYRQVPIRRDHLRYSYFSVYNHKLGAPQIYQLQTLPFGATHSVYNFLRLSKILHVIAVRGLHLLATTFYDDFIIATQPELVESAKHSMELVFILTGWLYAKDGKKATDFGHICKALGVEFCFSRSEEFLMEIYNTEQRVADLTQHISVVLAKGAMGRHETLVLRGRLSFADSFLHGRLGNLILKQLVEHAYSTKAELDDGLKLSLALMSQRLQTGKPRSIGAVRPETWYLYTDASYEPTVMQGGLGAVLIDSAGTCVEWFGMELSQEVCKRLNPDKKETIIYELELAAYVLATYFWLKKIETGVQVAFGDNDSVRYALIRGSAVGTTANALLEFHIKNEASANLCTWYARVPTESNISDWPSRSVSHPLLRPELDVSQIAAMHWKDMMELFNGSQTIN